MASKEKKSLYDYIEESAPPIPVEHNIDNYSASGAVSMGVLGMLLSLTLKYLGPNNWSFDFANYSFDTEYLKVIWWFSLLERVFCIVMVTNYANKLNRNPIGWQIFSFFTPYISLIAIGLSSRKNNFFYEYKTSDNRTDFFRSLSTTDKLILYNHILNRADTSISPHWWNEIAKMNNILFANKRSALSTLRLYEQTFNKNLIKVLKKNMPSSLELRESLFESLEKLGLVDYTDYQIKGNGLQ
jgi:hypothetical protein